MKNKSLFLTFFAMLFVMSTFAFCATTQIEPNVVDTLVTETPIVDDSIVDEPVEETSNSLMGILLAVFVPGAIGALSVLISDASKHIGSGEWSWSIFFKTKIKPFLLVNVLAIGLILAVSFLPNHVGFLSDLVGTDLTNLTTASLFAAATAILDGFLKKDNK